MNDDARASLAGFLAHQDQPKPDVPEITSSQEGHVSSAEAIWLVMATHLRGLELAGVVDERSTATLAGALERAAEMPAAGGSLRRMAQALESRVDAGLPDDLRGAATLGLAHEEWTGTAVRLVVRTAALQAEGAAIDAQRALVAMAELHAASLMQGFHTGRPVQPVSFGHLLGGAIGPMDSGIARLRAAFDQVNRSPLGAGTMAGEVVGAERSETSVWLGFSAPVPNTYDAVANVEDLVMLAEALASVTAPLARLVDEMAVMVRTDPSSLVVGDDWMRAPDTHLPGFSVAEGLVRLAQQLRAVDTSAHALVMRLRQLPYGPVGLANDWIVVDTASLVNAATTGCSEVAELFGSALTVNRAYLANRAGREFTTSNDLATFLMTEEHLPPSVARDIAGLTMRRLRDENLEVSAILPDHVDMAAMMVIGRELKVEMETLGRWFAPRRYLERRQAAGSPAPTRTRSWIEQEREVNRKGRDDVASRRLKTRDAEVDVRQWISGVAGADHQD